ncbi:MAG: alkaline phosphatase D family protein [Verrucomicrobiales bacterium]|nr:alkaline phosphatase D family protein [Verrucomicrobiales bacterium]
MNQVIKTNTTGLSPSHFLRAHSASLLLTVGLLLPCGVNAAQPSAGQTAPVLDLKAAHLGTPEIDQALLESSSPSDSVRAFFAEARETFAAQPKATLAELPAVREAAERHGIVLLGGPLLGALSSDGARVWVRTVKPAKVTVVVQVGEGEHTFGPVATTVESDLTAVVSVTGLKPAGRHPYRVLVDGNPVPIPTGAAITTAPAAAAATRMTIAFGADFHKTGLWNRALLDQIRAVNPAALLLLGDNAVDDRDNQVGLHRCDYLLRDLSPGWRELVGSVPVYATWDDHDYFNNDLSGIPPRFTAADRAAVRKVWTQSWNNPSYGFEGRGEGIFCHTRIGPCDVIMLDTRFFRTKPREPDCFLGADQMRWLEEELAACTGSFIILTSATMWSDYVSAGKDSWGVWDPAGRERILSLIEERRIGGVLLLSGDRHGARVLRIPRPSGFVFHEFELGSLGAHPGPAAMGKEPAQQPFGLTGKSLFGTLALDTTVDDPTVTLRIVDQDGGERYRLILTRSQMTPPVTGVRQSSAAFLPGFQP